MNQKNILLALLIVATFGVGVLVGNLTANGTSDMKDAMSDAAESMMSENEEVDANSPQGEQEVVGTVSTDNLTEGQKAMLNTLGIDASEITVTAEMMACAEAKIGATRVEAIKAGDSPTMSEGFSLMSCYSTN